MITIRNMNKLNILFILAMSIAITSCNPKITTSLSKSYPTLDYRQEVIVIGINEPAPVGSELLGQVKIGDTGFSTNCGYDVAIDKAKLEARKAGGNAIKIIEHKPPTALGSSCHKITAEILRIENIENLALNKAEEVLLDIDHAIFYIYRQSGTGFLVSYDLYLGDTVICRVKNNYKTKIKIYRDGLNSIWARTESKTEIPINVKIGKEYYIKCGVSIGAFIGRPTIELVDKSIGENEFSSIKSKPDFKDIIFKTDGGKIECDIIREDDNKVYFKIIRDGKVIETFINKNRIERIEYSE
jgi:hypothetical protein